MATKQTGCRFSLSPMSDQYIDIILGAVNKTNTKNISSQTGRLSTIYRGFNEDIIDALKACFIYAFRDGVHMSMEMTFFKDHSVSSSVVSDHTPVNAPEVADIHFPVSCKMALYPLGVSDYQMYIDHMNQQAVKAGIHVETLDDVTVIKGDVHALFEYFSYINTYCLNNLDQYALEVTLSVNSPTPE